MWQNTLYKLYCKACTNLLKLFIAAHKSNCPPGTMNGFGTGKTLYMFGALCTSGWNVRTNSGQILWTAFAKFLENLLLWRRIENKLIVQTSSFRPQSVQMRPNLRANPRVAPLIGLEHLQNSLHKTSHSQFVLLFHLRLFFT